jgi:nitroreductase
MNGWTSAEKNAIAASALRAPSVHNTRPWVLELRDDRRVAELYQRYDRALPRHDPRGRDLLISCGAALEHVLVAMRVLGWVPATTLFPDVEHPDLVARVRTAGRAAPSTMDTAAHAAVGRRHSERGPFATRAVGESTVARLVAANRVDGVGLRRIRDPVELTALARLLSHAAVVLRADRAYQRELSAWTAPVRDPAPGAGVAAPHRVTTVPWAGLIRRSTTVPDVTTLASRLGHELLLVVETPDDGPVDHVRAGMAAESVWLAATHAGLAGALLTQPFQLAQARAGLVESLLLNGFPQLLLRLGHRAGGREVGGTP